MTIKTVFSELTETMTPETFEKVLQEMEHFSELIHQTNVSFLNGVVNEKQVALTLDILDQWCSEIMLILHCIRTPGKLMELISVEEEMLLANSKDAVMLPH
jgi:hypothetical protein